MLGALAVCPPPSWGAKSRAGGLAVPPASAWARARAVCPLQSPQCQEERCSLGPQWAQGGWAWGMDVGGKDGRGQGHMSGIHGVPGTPSAGWGWGSWDSRLVLVPVPVALEGDCGSATSTTGHPGLASAPLAATAFLLLPMAGSWLGGGRGPGLAPVLGTLCAHRSTVPCQRRGRRHRGYPCLAWCEEQAYGITCLCQHCPPRWHHPPHAGRRVGSVGLGAASGSGRRAVACSGRGSTLWCCRSSRLGIGLFPWPFPQTLHWGCWGVGPELGCRQS